jgi:hypothetical protein
VSGMGLSRTTKGRLASYGAPKQLLLIAEYVCMMGAVPRNLDLFEMFAGMGNLSFAFRAKGFKSEGFDVSSNPKEDLSTTVGFILALRGVLRLKIGALLWGGVPCSTWVYISRGTSGRSAWQPMGNTTMPCVRAANLVTARFAALVLLAVARGAQWLVEQPGSSVMDLHDRFKAIKSLGECGLLPTMHSVRFWMGAYGHFSAKPSKCFGDAC